MNKIVLEKTFPMHLTKRQFALLERLMEDDDVSTDALREKGWAESDIDEIDIVYSRVQNYEDP